MSENDRNNSHADETESVTGRSGRPKQQPIERLGSFKIEAAISSGGMGTVYRAYDKSMKRPVALKVLHPSLEISKKTQSRFAREAWIAGQLEHPNIIKVYSRGEENRLHYIAMELADGGSLTDLIKQVRESIPSGSDVTDTIKSEYINSILSKFVELASALEHIHSKSFIHRDIKPHNILISGPEKQFKFTDFGIAHAEDMTNLTKAGDFIGTVKYMSPELLTAHRAVVDKRTDIYSLGVSLYEALTLTLPFEADSEEKYITEILSGHSIPARKRNKRISRDLETVLLKATHHDPEKRYQTAAEFAEDLYRILENRPITARRERIVSRSLKHLKRNKKIVAAIFLTGLVSLSGFYRFYHWRATSRDREAIIKTLMTAAETGRSPFEIHPEWDRLSEKLRRTVLSGELDSTVIWFFKANSLYRYKFQESSLLKHATVGIRPQSINILEQEPDLGSQAYDSYLAILATTFEMSVDHLPFRKIGVIIQGYGSRKKEGVGVFEKLDSFLANAGGRHVVRIRSVTKHYLNAAFYNDFSKYKEELRRFPDVFDSTPELIIDSGGDTLVARGLNIAYSGEKGFRWEYYQERSSVGTYRVDGESTNGIEPWQGTHILSTLNLQPAQQTFIDTTIDSFTVFLHDDYPDNYPREVFRVPYKALIEEAIRISEITLVRTEQDKLWYKTQFFGRLPSSLVVPIVGDFSVTHSKSQKTVLFGKIRISLRTLDGFSHFIDMDIAYNDVRSVGSARKWSPDSTTYIMKRTTTVSIPDITFEQLIGLGRFDAILKIAPSIDAARLFADIDEFWGDTLIFDIKFQAFDSSGTN